MRRWFVLLLVLLLPLRGWIGEAMAGEMLAQRVAVAAAATQHGHAGPIHAQHGHGPAHRLAQAPEHDCLGHAHAQPHTDASAKAQLPDSGCGTCASCQVCSSVALGFHVPALPVIDFAQAPPSVRLPHFASAEPRLRDKPPIS